MISISRAGVGTTVSSAEIEDDSIVNADIKSTAAIDYSKLATLATGKILAGNANVPTATTLGGDATIGATGTLTIANSAVTSAKINDGTIVAGDISSSAAIAGTQLATDVVNDYHSILSAGVVILAGLTTRTNVMNSTNVASGATFASDLSTLNPIFYLDPADYAISGLTTYINVDASLYCNATAPGTQTFTVGLYPISAVAGAANTITVTAGAVTTGTTCAFVNPTNSTRNHVNSTDVAFPAAGYYALGCVNSATTAANSQTMVNARLRWRTST